MPSEPQNSPKLISEEDYKKILVEKLELEAKLDASEKKVKQKHNEAYFWKKKAGIESEPIKKDELSSESEPIANIAPISAPLVPNSAPIVTVLTPNLASPQPQKPKLHDHDVMSWAPRFCTDCDDPVKARNPKFDTREPLAKCTGPNCGLTYGPESILKEKGDDGQPKIKRCPNCGHTKYDLVE